jgi:hypothetical protein
MVSGKLVLLVVASKGSKFIPRCRVELLLWSLPAIVPGLYLGIVSYISLYNHVMREGGNNGARNLRTTLCVLVWYL